MSSTRKFLKAVGYAGTAIITGSLAETQQANFELFAIFTMATGVLAAGASCCTIAGVQSYQDEKSRRIDITFDDQDSDFEPK